MSDKNIAFYHRLTEEERVKYWARKLDMDYKTMDKPFCITYEHASRCVDAYQKAETVEEKNQLWLLYDAFTKPYCDHEKYMLEKKEKETCINRKKKLIYILIDNLV